MDNSPKANPEVLDAGPVCRAAVSTLSTALAQGFRQGSRLAVDATFLGLAEAQGASTKSEIAECQVTDWIYLDDIVSCLQSLKVVE